MSADDACQRCGAFAPRQERWGLLVCAQCEERMTAPPLRQQWRFLLRALRRIPIGVWLSLAAVHLTVAAPWSLVDRWIEQQSGELISRMSLVSWAMATYSAAIMIVLVTQHLTGHTMAVGEALITVRRRFVVVITFGVVTVGVFVVGLLLLVLPGLWWNASTWLVLPILLLERKGLVEAFSLSMRRMRGSLRIATLLLLIVLVPTFALSALAESIGDTLGLMNEALSLVTQPLMAALTGLMYLQLRSVRPPSYPPDERDRETPDAAHA